MHKKACEQFAEDKQTKDMDYWNYVLWSVNSKDKIALLAVEWRHLQIWLKDE